VKKTPKTKTPRAKSSTGRKKKDSAAGSKQTTDKKRGRPVGKSSSVSKASASGRKSARKTPKQKQEEAEALRMQLEMAADQERASQEEAGGAESGYGQPHELASDMPSARENRPDS